MSVRPSLVRSIPFWILIAGSLATSIFGLWLAVDKLGIMTTKLADGTATGLEVYVGQVWAIIGGVLIATGLIGLALALVLGVVRSFVSQPVVEVVAPIDWSDEDDTESEVEVVVVEAATDAPEPVVESEPAAAPVTQTSPQR